MKKLILSVGLAIACAYQGFGQNPGVILAPNYIDNVTGEASLKPLPIPSVADGNTNEFGDYADLIDGYDGQQATSAQNIILDKEGNIMFFIVDEGG
jgi:hypothetical protein